MPSVTMFGPMPDSDASMAATFYNDWFGPEAERFSVVARYAADLSPNRGAKGYWCDPPVTFLNAFREHSLEDLINFKDQAWNLYTSVACFKTRQTDGKKGGRKDVHSSPGAWSDMDKKPGAFRDEEHALSLLRAMPRNLWPTQVVATGTGGIQPWWKTREPLAPDMAEALTKMIRVHLARESGVLLDRVHNCDRILRLPGTRRWPKNGDEPVTQVRLIHSTPEGVSADDLATLCAPAWRDWLAQVREKRSEHQDMKHAANGALAGLTGRWGRLLTVAQVEDDFNAKYGWHEILTPMGWVDLGYDSEGRTKWGRPGQGLRPHQSAATDYNGSDVMSLFSSAPEVDALWQLHEAGVDLTKFQVYIALYFGGDQARYIDTIFNKDEAAL